MAKKAEQKVSKKKAPPPPDSSSEGDKESIKSDVTQKFQIIKPVVHEFDVKNDTVEELELKEANLKNALKKKTDDLKKQMDDLKKEKQQALDEQAQTAPAIIEFMKEQGLGWFKVGEFRYELIKKKPRKTPPSQKVIKTIILEELGIEKGTSLIEKIWPSEPAEPNEDEIEIVLERSRIE